MKPMNPMNPDELKEILAKHSKWVFGEDGGQRADLQRADLQWADLRGADLQGADLQRADLRGADLQGAYLQGAALQGAALQGADLRGADLQGADLERAALERADLQGAKDAELQIARTRILPEGTLIGWKKCCDNVLVKLRIPEAAKRSNALGRKCRAEYVEVLEVIGATEGISLYPDAQKVIYRVGETVRPEKPFDENWMEECASGIHFYLTRIEAENHE